MSWRIDALDARGGTAFASERAADLVDESPDWRIDPSSPSVVMTAPGFVPESTPSRALGLAATRGTFQFGFLVDGEEVPFASLEDLSEFVRRAYLRSSGGSDDTSGGGLPPGPGPEGEGGGEPDLPFEPRGEGAWQVLNWSKAFTVAMSESHLGQPGAPMADRFQPFRATEADAVEPDGALVGGLKLLYAELLARRPKAFTGVNGDAWMRSAAALGTLTLRLDLVRPMIRALGTRPAMERELYETAAAIDRVLHLGMDPGPDTFVSFMIAAGGTANWRITREFIRHGDWYWWDHSRWWSPDEDILRVLQAIPVPRAARRFLEGASVDPKRQNLMNLLPALLASPQGLGSDPSAANLLLVIAAAITADGARRTASPLTRLQDDPALPVVILQAAGDWLRDAFPRIALSDAVENAIEQDALRVRYEAI